MLRSGSDLIITGGSSLGVAIAIETVGEEEGEEEQNEEVEEEEEEKEENATEEEVEGREKTVVGKPGWPRGVRMIVFVPAVQSKVFRLEWWEGEWWDAREIMFQVVGVANANGATSLKRSHQLVGHSQSP